MLLLVPTATTPRKAATALLLPGEVPNELPLLKNSCMLHYDVRQANGIRVCSCSHLLVLYMLFCVLLAPASVSSSPARLLCHRAEKIICQKCRSALQKTASLMNLLTAAPVSR